MPLSRLLNGELRRHGLSGGPRAQQKPSLEAHIGGLMLVL